MRQRGTVRHTTPSSAQERCRSSRRRTRCMPSRRRWSTGRRGTQWTHHPHSSSRRGTADTRTACCWRIDHWHTVYRWRTVCQRCIRDQQRRHRSAATATLIRRGSTTQLNTWCRTSHRWWTCTCLQGIPSPGLTSHPQGNMTLQRMSRYFRNSVGLCRQSRSIYPHCKDCIGSLSLCQGGTSCTQCCPPGTRTSNCSLSSSSYHCRSRMTGQRYYRSTLIGTGCTTTASCLPRRTDPQDTATPPCRQDSSTHPSSGKVHSCSTQCR